MFTAITKFRQSVAHVRELIRKVDRLERQLANVTELHQQIQASSDADEMSKLRTRMKVVHPLAVDLKLGDTQRALRHAKTDAMTRLRECREEAVKTVTSAAGGPGGLYNNPRAKILLTKINRANIAALKVPPEERLAQYDAVIELMNQIDGELPMIRESAERWKAAKREGRVLMLSKPVQLPQRTGIRTGGT